MELQKCIENAELIRTQAYIGGHWLDAGDAAVLEVTDPGLALQLAMSQAWALPKRVGLSTLRMLRLRIGHACCPKKEVLFCAVGMT